MIGIVSRVGSCPQVTCHIIKTQRGDALLHCAVPMIKQEEQGVCFDKHTVSGFK